MRVIFRPLDVAADWPWIRQHIPLLLVERVNGVIAYDGDTGQRIAAMVCDSWTHTSAECHFINTHIAALKHGFHRECAEYLFGTAARKMVYGKVPSDNEKALKLNKHLGFREIVRLEDAAAIGIDIVLMELRAEDCPYWESK